jgi:hypothetical protein
VSQLKFTKDEKFLVALGNIQGNLYEFYVEVIDWREETVIDSLLLQNFVVSHMFINKCDPFEFGVCGYGVMRVFRLFGKNLKTIENINIFPHFYPPVISSNKMDESGVFEMNNSEVPDFNKVPVLTCGTFYYYVFTDSQERDIILGTDLGDLAVVTFSKFSIVKKNAHEGMINLLRYVIFYYLNNSIISFN